MLGHDPSEGTATKTADDDATTVRDARGCGICAGIFSAAPAASGRVVVVGDVVRAIPDLDLVC